MRKSCSLFLMVCVQFLLVGCSEQQKSSMVLQREWTANSEFAGDVWASELARKDGLDIKVLEGSEIIDPIKMVLSGRAQIGVISADRILRENEGANNLVVIAVASHQSPVVFLSQDKLGIKYPSDFKNRVLGVQAGTNSEIVFNVIKKRYLGTNNVRVVEPGWGTATFESKTLDILTAFDYDEPVLLDKKGYKYTVLRPRDFGVKFIGTVYFTTRKYLEKNPDRMQVFMNYLVDGWQAAINNPEAAVKKINSRFGSIDQSKELSSFMKGIPYFSGEGGRLLYASEATWKETAKILGELNMLKEDRYRFSDNVNYRFLFSALNRLSKESVK